MADITMPQLGETEVMERTIPRPAQPAARILLARKGLPD